MPLSRELRRHVMLISVDALIIAFSYVLALKLSTTDITDIRYAWYEYVWMIAVVLIIKLFIFVKSGLYKEMVRYVSMDFAVKLVKLTIFGSLISISIIHVIRREIQMPVMMVDWMASCIMVGLSRFGWRYVKEGRLSRSLGRRTLLYGAGEHGTVVSRHLTQNDRNGYRVIGFIDDDQTKHGKKVQGVPVLGGCSDLPEIISRYAIEELVIAFANPEGDLTKKVFRICRECGVRCRMVPGMSDIISGAEVVRSIDLSDLMRRPPCALDEAMVAKLVKGRRVLITGAAGSIGSEIVRQILAFEPTIVAALDHSEYGLYVLDEELAQHPLKDRCFFSLVDVKCRGLIQEAMSRVRPEIIFHAAAYKHVPILEQDVCQAVRNNVEGLVNVMEAAKDCGAEKFVFISTDKAVRPTNVMGATKRIGELIIQSNNGDHMRCCAVRFGNVLASSGSVVPKFVDQIKAGGPVTVTHPEVTRYFMLIPEAVELVLQAAALGEGGEVFVLDMGKPVRIAEMAEDLIALMGHVPHADIPIVYTGLRPGEKLHEELFVDDVERQTRFADIRVGRVGPVDQESLRNGIQLLVGAATEGRVEAARAQLCKLVPEYSPQAASDKHLIN